MPEGLEPGTPFSVNILALAIYLRFTHAISYQRLSRLFLHLFALQISEGALDAIFRRAKPCFDNEVAAILARLRRSRIICSDETTVRIDGRTHWNWVFQNQQVVIHVIRNSRAASVVADVLDGHRPSIWVSDLYSAQQGHADLWQICLLYTNSATVCNAFRHSSEAPVALSINAVIPHRSLLSHIWFILRLDGLRHILLLSGRINRSEI